ncbi:hypothetical protein DL96DRAFT_1814192 [Flagelloscypha sp. PMI_526]|nr:hypothetical protein DL96DRAFT_1814192 [Flagelloscypha sp. PMI_526]
MADFPASRARAHYLASLERKIFLFHDENESSTHINQQLQPLIDALAAKQVVAYSCNGPDAAVGEESSEFSASWSAGDEHRIQTHTLPFIRSVIIRKGAFYAVIGAGQSTQIAARFAEQYSPTRNELLDITVDGGNYPIFVASPQAWFLIHTQKPTKDSPVLNIPVQHVVDFISNSIEAGVKFDPNANHGMTDAELRAKAKARKEAELKAAAERTAYNAERRALKALKEAGDHSVIVPPRLPKLHPKKDNLLRDTVSSATSSLKGSTPRYQKFEIDSNELPDPNRPFHTYNLAPLMEWLAEGEALPDDEQRVDFYRGSLLQRNGLAVDLCKQVVGGEGIAPVLDAVGRNKHVVRFLLGNNVTGLSGAQAMAAFLADHEKCSSIYNFYIAGNNINEEGIRLISEALVNNTTLTALWLKRNPLMPQGGQHLASMLRLNNTLQTLDIVNCGVMDEGAVAIFEALKDATLSPTGSALRHFYLGTNGLTPKTAKAAGELLRTGQSRLKTLVFACGRIGDEGAEYLAEGLRADQELMGLGLASECITAKGAKVLADAIAVHPKMTALFIGFRKATFAMGEWPNVLGDEGVDYLVRTLLGPAPANAPPGRLGIRTLDVTSTGASVSTLRSLLPVIESSKHIQNLSLLQFRASKDKDNKKKGMDEDMKNVQHRAKAVCDKNKFQWEQYGMGLVDGSEEKRVWEDVMDTLEPRHLDDIFSVYRTNM